MRDRWWSYFLVNKKYLFQATYISMELVKEIVRLEISTWDLKSYFLFCYKQKYSVSID